MCIVSAIHDYAKNIPYQEWSKESFDAWQEMIKRAEEFDKITNQPDCVDPEKEKLVREVIEYLKQQGKL